MLQQAPADDREPKVRRVDQRLTRAGLAPERADGELGGGDGEIERGARGRGEREVDRGG